LKSVLKLLTRLRSFEVLLEFDPELPIKLAGDACIGIVISLVFPKLMEKNVPLLSHQKLCQKLRRAME